MPDPRPAASTLSGREPRARGGPPTVFFLSDFGERDEFAGVVRAVLHRLVPGVTTIDLTHGIAPFDVAGGALALERAVPHLGEGVVLAVVDPGVGTERRGVAIRVGAQTAASMPASTSGTSGAGHPTWLVGPDNGLLVPAARRLGPVEEVRVLAGASTFDGRDVFAPAVAHLCTGGDPAELGTSADPASLVALAADAAGPEGPDDAGEVRVAVRWVDRYGNVQLDLAAGGESPWGGPWPDRLRVRVEPLDRAGPGELRTRCVRGFGHLDPGELGMLRDADGRCALVLAEASAADLLGIRSPYGGRARPVVLRPDGYHPRR